MPRLSRRLSKLRHHHGQRGWSPHHRRHSCSSLHHGWRRGRCRSMHSMLRHRKAAACAALICTCLIHPWQPRPPPRSYPPSWRGGTDTPSRQRGHHRPNRTRWPLHSLSGMPQPLMQLSAVGRTQICRAAPPLPTAPRRFIPRWKPFLLIVWLTLLGEARLAAFKSLSTPRHRGVNGPSVLLHRHRLRRPPRRRPRRPPHHR